MGWLSVSAVAFSMACRSTPDCEGRSQPLRAVDSLRATTVWQMRAERFRPGNGATLLCAEDGVPVRFSTAAPSKDSKTDRIVFLLTDSAAGLATTGIWQGGYTASEVPYGSLLLGFTSPAPGSYTGKLTVGPASTTIVLRVTHWVMLPGFTIFLGVLLSYAMQRYRAFARTLMLLRMRAERIVELLAQAQGAFQATIARSATPIGAPSLRADVDRQIAAVSRDIADVRIVSAALDSSNVRYVNICSTLDALESAVATFPLLATDLVALGNAVSDGRALAQNPGRPSTSTTPVGSEPPVLAAAAGELVGREIATADLASSRTSVQAKAAVLRRWNGAMGQLVAIIQDLEKARADQPDKIAAIEDLRASKVELIWRQVYDAADSAALDTALGWLPFETISGDLAAILGTPAKALARAAAIAASAAGANVVMQKATIGSAFAAAVAAFRAALTPHVLADAEQSRRAAAAILLRIRLLDVAFLALALAAAVVTGLNQFYYGKVFGTAQDYMLAFVWGFGTKTLLDATLSGINRIVGGAPTSSPSDAPPIVHSGAPPVQAL